MAFVRLNSGSITADEEFLQTLVALELDTMRGVFAYEGRGFLRTHANRDNFHLVHEVGGRVYDLFLKRHRGFELKETLKFLAARRPFLTAGRREWDNILALESLSIPTMRPVAVGQEKWLFLEKRSFLVTERIADAVPMDDYIRSRYAPPLHRNAIREKQALLWDAGDLVRRLHGAGFTHMDLYLNHIFVRETPEGDKILHLIDLQRLARRRFLRRRWIVKDLAALLYSTRRLPLSRSDVARIFAAYFDGGISPHDRPLLREAIVRCRRLMDRAEASR